MQPGAGRGTLTLSEVWCSVNSIDECHYAIKKTFIPVLYDGESRRGGGVVIAMRAANDATTEATIRKLAGDAFISWRGQLGVTTE